MALTSAVQQLWNEWEIQCVVLVSFSLQVFLLIFSGIRKRHAWQAINLLLWLAYLLADYVATFALGRLTYHLNEDPRNQLMLFWTPFLLLHLGGQDTMTAFSTEDCLLWTRHLLSLVSQVVLAVYIVAKSWHDDSSSKQLVAPVALMFIVGTVKYAERTTALKSAAGWMTPERTNIPESQSHTLYIERSVMDDAMSYFQRLNALVSSAQRDGKQDYYKDLVAVVAGTGHPMCMQFFTDMTPYLRLNWPHSGNIIDRTIKNLQDLRNQKLGAQIAYKLAEIHLSLIYDFFYTKYGMHPAESASTATHLVCSGILRLIKFGATSAALSLFLKAHLDGLFSNLSRADVIVSYVLLVGAFAMELSSIFLAISSWPYRLYRDDPFDRARIQFPSRRTMFYMARFVNPVDKGLWSGKMAQYNLIRECIEEKQGNQFMMDMRRIGLLPDITTHEQVSPGLKMFVFSKLLGIATTRHGSHYRKWDFSTFRGQWLRWELETTEEGRSIDQTLLNIEAEGGDFTEIVLIWHLTTEMCLYTDKEEDPPCRMMSQQLSNYVLYLVAKCGVKSGRDGYFELRKFRLDLKEAFLFSGGRLELRYGRKRHYYARASDVTNKELRKVTCPNRRWELIAIVWVEMLCYLAPNCGTRFHINKLRTGGEFVSQVRILLIILGIPFLRAPSQEAQDEDDAQDSDMAMV